MAISSLDNVIAGSSTSVFPFYKFVDGTVTAGRLYSPFYERGYPGTGSTISTSTLAGTALTSYPGQLTFANPPSGQKTYLTRFAGSATIAGTLYLYDRLWHNSGINLGSTAAQTINSATFPARDISGGTSGEGVLIGVEVSSGMGAQRPTFTMGYTASNGATATVTTAAIPASTNVGDFIPIPLVSGHTGVKSIQTWQQSTTISPGAYSLVAYRILGSINIGSASVGDSQNIVSIGFPQLYDNTVPFLLFLSPTGIAALNSGTITGNIAYTQG